MNWRSRPVWVWTVALALPCQALAQGTEMTRVQEDAVRRVQEYLRVNTINPPGNETRGVEFFRRIFEAEGIRYETVEPAPGRGSIWARLDGGPEPALVLLHHMDVVPADSSYWDTDPLSGEVRNGHIYGRGALDTKTLGILHLEAFLALHRSGRPLRRPVIFMATADEEAGGMLGAGWLVANRPDVFRGVELLLNEGGAGSESAGRRVFEVEVTQKVPLWIRIVATGEPGHGSTPRPVSAVSRLVRALDNLRSHRFPARLVPAVEAYLTARAQSGMGPFADRLARPAEAVRDTAFLDRLQAENPFLAALTRNTCTITRLEGSTKINVVPPRATAEVDCRLLPDQDPDAFLALLATVLDEPTLSIEKIMAFSPAVSPTDTDLFRAISGVIGRHFPQAPLLPSVQTGFTDSHFFRDLGITSYGFSPIVVPGADAGGVHGNNERVSIENVRRGVVVMLEVVQAVVY
jgi:acetylornithine deacetylase/succinyl-diaminopimelate desuccinylase-like protein